jgi:hypothetical protein
MKKQESSKVYVQFTDAYSTLQQWAFGCPEEFPDQSHFFVLHSPMMARSDMDKSNLSRDAGSTRPGIQY